MEKADEKKAMDRKTRARYEARAQICKALGHPTRLFIVDRLSEHERCVCELTDMVGVDISTVSRHLSVLKNAGLVEADKRGTQVYYSLKVPCVVNFFSCMESVLETLAEEREEVL